MLKVLPYPKRKINLMRKINDRRNITALTVRSIAKASLTAGHEALSPYSTYSAKPPLQQDAHRESDYVKIIPVSNSFPRYDLLPPNLASGSQTDSSLF